MDLQIRIKNFEKYKGRSDVKNNTWFRLSNRFLEDHEFFDFTSDEKLVWIYLLSIASQKNHGDIHVSYQHAHHVCKIEKNVLTTSIEKLNKINCIEKIRTRTLRGRYARVSNPCATEQNRTEQTEQDRTEQVLSTEPNKSVSVAKPEKQIVEFKLSESKQIQVSRELVNSWIDTFPKEFLDEEIKKARSWVLSNEHKAPKSQWGRFLNSWFNRGWERYRTTLKSNPSKVSLEELTQIWNEASQ